MRIDACVKVVPFVKQNRATGDMLVMLTNAFLDPTGIFEVRIRANGKTPCRINRMGECEPLPSRRDGNDSVVSLSLNAWEFAVIKVGR